MPLKWISNCQKPLTLSDHGIFNAAKKISKILLKKKTITELDKDGARFFLCIQMVKKIQVRWNKGKVAVFGPFYYLVFSDVKYLLVCHNLLATFF